MVTIINDDGDDDDDSDDAHDEDNDESYGYYHDYDEVNDVCCNGAGCDGMVMMHKHHHSL